MKKQRKKVCPHCGRKLWLRDWYILKAGCTSQWCKDCMRESKREWYDKNRRVRDGIHVDQSSGRLYQKKGNARYIFWSKQMLDDLRRLYPTTTNENMEDILGVGRRTLIRKARELGIEKDAEWMRQKTMLGVKAMHLSNRIHGNKGTFKKGVRNCPEHEFKPGHKLTEEQKARQRESLRRWCIQHPVEVQRRSEKLRKAVVCVETGERHPSIAVAAKCNNRSANGFSQCIKAGRPVNGRTWVFA